MELFSENKLFYNLALTKIEGIGAVNARKIAAKYDNLEELFKKRNHKNEKFDGIPKIVFERIKAFNDFQIIEDEIKFIIDNKIQVLLYTDEKYPADLKECYDAPFILYAKGKINFNNNKIVSIVGSRNVTSYGIGFLKEFIQDLKKYNPLIISGYAYGVDISAHLTALENELQTVAILGHALNKIYPKNHKKYEKSILEHGGFLSEFSTFDSFNKENFIKRNRIVAGVSKATIVVESAIKGGSLSTARFANDYNREVFALSGRSTDVYSAGCNHLIKTNQAHLITSAEDLVYLLNWDIEPKCKKEIKPFEIPIDLNQEERKVVLYLQKNGIQILDVIAVETNLPVCKLSVILLHLELRDVIIPLPGKQFDLKK